MLLDVDAWHVDLVHGSACQWCMLVGLRVCAVCPVSSVEALACTLAIMHASFSACSLVQRVCPVSHSAELAHHAASGLLCCERPLRVCWACCMSMGRVQLAVPNLQTLVYGGSCGHHTVERLRESIWDVSSSNVQAPSSKFQDPSSRSQTHVTTTRAPWRELLGCLFGGFQEPDDDKGGPKE